VMIKTSLARRIPGNAGVEWEDSGVSRALAADALAVEIEAECLFTVAWRGVVIMMVKSEIVRMSSR